MLEQCHAGPQQQRHQAAQADQVEEPLGAGQRRIQPGQQEYAGLDHGRRVQVRGNRGRRRHRVGQPEMEGKLRRLGEHAEQDQYQHQRIQGVGADQLASREDLGEFEAAGDVAEQQHPGQQRQAAPSGNGQGHPRTLAGVGTAAPEADEQERGQAGQLPEEHHQQEIFREHHAEHGAHEQQQESEETPHRLLFGEVVAGVEDHQQADAEDQQGEEETEAVQAQAEVDADFRQPGIAGGQGLPGEHRAALPEQQDQADQRRHAGGRRAQGAAATLGKQGQQRPHERQRDDQRQNHGLLLFDGGAPACLAGGASPRLSVRGRIASSSKPHRPPAGTARRNYDYRNLSNERHGLNYYKIQAFRLPESRKNSATATT